MKDLEEYCNSKRDELIYKSVGTVYDYTNMLFIELSDSEQKINLTFDFALNQGKYIKVYYDGNYLSPFIIYDPTLLLELKPIIPKSAQISSYFNKKPFLKDYILWYMKKRSKKSTFD